jgi:hypothetical protein
MPSKPSGLIESASAVSVRLASTRAFYEKFRSQSDGRTWRAGSDTTFLGGAGKRSRHATSTSDGLLTPKVVASDLGISTKTLKGHADDGEIRYINVARGKKNKRRMFRRADVDEFKERRAQREVKCPSTDTKTARSTTMTSSSKVVAFTALRDARVRERPKPSNGPSGSGRSCKPS